MKTQYTNLDIPFSLGGLSVHPLNIIFERFTRVIPAHSHGNGCYEIHYIPAGFGRLEVDGAYYDISPNTLFVTGPHIVHAQSPLPSDPMQEYCVYVRIPGASRSRKPSPLMDAFLSTRFWIGQDLQGIHLLMKQLFDELEHQYTGYQNQVGLLLSQLIISLVRNYEQEEKPKYHSATDTLYNSKSIIIEEYFLYEYRTLSLDALAKRLNLSARQTQRLCRITTAKLFNKKRQKRACLPLPSFLTNTAEASLPLLKNLAIHPRNILLPPLKNIFTPAPALTGKSKRKKWETGFLPKTFKYPPSPKPIAFFFCLSLPHILSGFCLFRSLCGKG